MPVRGSADPCPPRGVAVLASIGIVPYRLLMNPGNVNPAGTFPMTFAAALCYSDGRLWERT